MSPILNKKRISLRKKLSYSVGHVLNDLVASMFLSYWIVYLNKVIQFDSGLAGIVFLLGQISDALFTPFIGYKSDRSGCFNYGRRKSWHLFGTICVTMTFPFLFIDDIVSSNSANWVQFIYYATFFIVFHIGYASIQISHLSLIPELTSEGIERVGLTSYRYSFTVISNMTLYGIAWALFDFMHSADATEGLGPGDSNNFRTLALIVVGIGIFASVIFHVGVKETKPEVTNSTEEHADVKKMKWKQWLKETQFYQVAVIYMCSRLIVNMSQVYLPFYITETIKLDKTSIANMPFIVYISGLVTSFLMRYVNETVGRKITFSIGILFTLGGCVTFYLLKDGSKFVYMAVVLNGIGGSTVLVTSLSMIADLINSNTESGAFVYGAIGVTEKLATGVGIALIQQLNPCGSTCCPQCGLYFRNILTFVPGCVSLFASVVLATLVPVNIGFRRNQGIIQSMVPISQQTVTEPGSGNNVIASSVTKETQFSPELCNDWL